MYALIAIAILSLVFFLSEIIGEIYDRVTYNIIVNKVNDEFQELLDENDHKLDYYHIDDFMIKHYDVVEDILIDLDENNNMVYTLKFKDWV